MRHDKGAPDKGAPDKGAPDKGAPNKCTPDSNQLKSIQKRVRLGFFRVSSFPAYEYSPITKYQCNPLSELYNVALEVSEDFEILFVFHGVKNRLVFLTTDFRNFYVVR